MGIEAPGPGGKPISYKELCEYSSVRNPSKSLAHEVFGPGSFVESPLTGSPPDHPVNGAIFGPAHGDWDLIPPHGSFYMDSFGLPNPEHYRPDLF